MAGGFSAYKAIQNRHIRYTCAFVTDAMLSTLQAAAHTESAPVPEEDRQPGQFSGPSWGVMLLLLFLAIAVACGIAYWLIYPYTHRHSL